MVKARFMFGDHVATNEAGMETDAVRWVREVDGERYFLPPRLGHYSITRLSRRALPRRADWALTYIAYGVMTGELVHSGAVSRPHREVLGLQSGSLCAELSGNDTAVQARIFMNHFAQTGHVNYPARPRLPGWVLAHDGDWWPR